MTSIAPSTYQREAGQAHLFDFDQHIIIEAVHHLPTKLIRQQISMNALHSCIQSQSQLKEHPLKA